MTGKVKFYNTKKGFGFILGEDGNEYFVHYNGINKTSPNEKRFKKLPKDSLVSFDITENEKGLVATNVSLTE